MKRRRKHTEHSGSTLDSLLKEDGILEEVEAVAIKRVKAWQRKRSKGHIDRSETFDDFLAKDGLLAETEDAAIREIAANQRKMEARVEQQNSRVRME